MRYPTGQVRDSVIVALGDSTTAGTPGFRSPLEAPPDGTGDSTSQFAYWLMDMRPQWRVLNCGINRQRSDEIAARFDRDVLSHRPDAVIVIAGVNDIYDGRSAGDVQQVLHGIYARARAEHIPLVAGSILPFNTATPDQNRRIREVNDWIREYGRGNPGIVFCDTRRAVSAPGAPERLAASPDGLHPSADGYRLMALALEPVLRAILKRAAASGVK